MEGPVINNIHKHIYRWFRSVIKKNPTKFWTDVNVTAHHIFSSREESLDYFNWRNSLYLFYEDLMPCAGFDGKMILDFGCGPGNDLVGFLEYSHPKNIIGVDISSSSIQEAKKRVTFHNDKRIPIEIMQISDGVFPLPFDDATFDYIHSSGVLHHVQDMNAILKEFHRILKDEGFIRIMVYNRDSIFFHLFVAYQRRILEGSDQGVPIEEAFKRSTDGESCPISRCFTKEDFMKICERAGFEVKFLGNAISLGEMDRISLIPSAISDLSLEKEHRDFLRKLEYDQFNRPLYNQEVAGIDACFEVRKTKKFIIENV
jgi:ubiquinone/menaquinone biosynthesis C-methylase UbiE